MDTALEMAWCSIPGELALCWVVASCCNGGMHCNGSAGISRGVVQARGS